MPKKEMPKSTLGGFNLKGYMKQNTSLSDNESDFEKENKPVLPEEHMEAAPKKTPVREKTAAKEEKIAFMNYLPLELHDEFSLIFLKAKQELRGRTKKALSQTELVEAILRNAVEQWQVKKEDFLSIAEEIINNRRSKE